MNTIHKNTISLIKEEYLRDNTEWTIGYSGGKDSSALLKLCLSALKELKELKKYVNIVYCNTGVEIPIIAEYVYQTLKKLREEAAQNSIPINIKIAKPEIENSFFVKMIGRGYPPPTNIFRWCTRRLRIKPLQDALYNSNDSNLVLLGIRRNESNERDRIIDRHVIDGTAFLKQKRARNSRIFSPLIYYSTSAIWDALVNTSFPKCIDHRELQQFYRINKKNANVDGLRFGCWTCTVVRKDKAMMTLIDSGFKELVPLIEFRDWLMIIRNKDTYRASHRRNGTPGLGPFTLETRKLILERLLETEKRSGYSLISDEEINRIHDEWKKDQHDSKYIDY